MRTSPRSHRSVIYDTQTESCFHALVRAGVQSLLTKIVSTVRCHFPLPSHSSAGWVSSCASPPPTAVHPLRTLAPLTVAKKNRLPRRSRQLRRTPPSSAAEAVEGAALALACLQCHPLPRAFTRSHYHQRACNLGMSGMVLTGRSTWRRRRRRVEAN